MNKKLPAILVVLAVVGVLGWLAMGSVGDNLVYYWTPTELHAAGAKAGEATVRLGGLVKPGSVSTEGNATLFLVTDGKEDVKVRTQEIPPQMFRECIGVVVEGTMTRAGVFEADRLMVKHSNEYRAPEAGKAPEDLYKTVEDM